MNKIFLVRWSVIFETSDIMRFKTLVWATSEEEAKARLLNEKAKNVRDADGFLAIVEVEECIPKDGFFYLGRF